jgi:hypothetical protein
MSCGSRRFSSLWPPHLRYPTWWSFSCTDSAGHAPVLRYPRANRQRHCADIAPSRLRSICPRGSCAVCRRRRSPSWRPSDDVAAIDQHVAVAVAADVAERDGFGGSADRGHGRKTVAGARESRTLARLRPMPELCEGPRRGRLTGRADQTGSMSAQPCALLKGSARLTHRFAYPRTSLTLRYRGSIQNREPSIPCGCPVRE